jgi:hypothetical protein
MADIKAGDRVRIKDRTDWPMPSGYKLANLEGRVFDTVDKPEGYILVLLDTDAAGMGAGTPLGFPVAAVEKI